MTKNTSPEQLLETLENINLAAREGFNQIEAVAQAIKMILERPDRQNHLVEIAHMVMVIRDLAQSTRDGIESELLETGVQPVGNIELTLMFPGGVDGHLNGVH